MSHLDSRRSDALIACGLLAFCGFAAWRTTLVKTPGTATTMGPTFVPWLMIGGIAVLSLFLLFRALRGRGAREEGRIEMPDRPTLIRMAIFLVILVAYAAAFMTAGYIASTLAVFVAGLWLFGERRPLVLILVPIAVTAIVYLGFTRFLNVWLP